MLQYRAAALAGFATQCWWGGIKIMIYAAFFHAGARAAGGSMSLAQTITYTWLAQGFLALSPWGGDPDVAAAVRTGAVSYDRLRPVDGYAWWYARTAGWMTARAVPRAALMFLVAGIALPLLGFGDWSWRLPPNGTQEGLFALSMVMVVALSSALTNLVNVIIAATLTDRGVNVLVSPLSIMLSGGLLPLKLFPDWAQTALLLQPFAGIIDIPFRIYFGDLAGAAAWMGIGLQVFWTVVLVAGGRLWFGRVMARLQVQGG